MPIKVLHLVDDMTAGGVTRVLDHIISCPLMSETADHQVKYIRRGAMSFEPTDADMIVSHLSISWRGLPGLIALRATNPKRALVHVEHSYTENFVLHIVRRKARFFTLLRTAYALFDQVVAVSHGQGKWLAKQELVQIENLSVIQSTVNYAPFRKLPPSTGPVRVFGAIGRLDRQKGFDRLIESFKKVRGDVQLRIFGTGPEEQNLRILAKDDPRIQFCGFVEDTAQAYEQIDVFVVPSRWEAYGLVVAEALEAGRRVLVNPVDGLQDHITVGVIAVDGDEIETWVAAIEDQLASTGKSQPEQNVSREMKFAQDWARLIETCTSICELKKQAA